MKKKKQLISDLIKLYGIKGGDLYYLEKMLGKLTYRDLDNIFMLTYHALVKL